MGSGQNPFALMRSAASGSSQGFRQLAQLALEKAEAERDIAAAFEAITFSWLAYSRTDSPEDAGRLIKMLSVAVDLFPQSELLQATWLGQAIAISERCSDRGFPMSEDLLPLMVEESGPIATEVAKQVSEFLKKADRDARGAKEDL